MIAILGTVREMATVKAGWKMVKQHRNKGKSLKRDSELSSVQQAI